MVNIMVVVALYYHGGGLYRGFPNFFATVGGETLTFG